MFGCVDRRLRNNVYLGLCFVVLFSSFKALTNVQKTITTSIQRDDPTYTADGYVSLGVLYTTFSIFMWFSPVVIAKLGPKYIMILGASFYGFFMATFYPENDTWVYFGSALCGIGASLLWTGQGNYIVLNAEIGKVYSGIGIFWIIFQASHFFGNMVVYLQFNDINQAIDKPLRRRIITIFVSFAAIGVLMMLGIKEPIRKKEDETKLKPWSEVVKSGKMLLSPRMLILCITMICLGFHLTFLNVLSASMGFSRYLSDNSKELVPLCGLLHGVGEIIGGILSITIGGRTICQTKPLITLACGLNALAYMISLLVLPTNSANFYTNDQPIIVLPTAFLLAAAIFVGVGDACFHTELYDYLGARYPDDSAPAIAILKFVSSLATACSFYYSRVLNLHTQIIILLSLTLLSWISYHYIQWFMTKSPPTNQNKKKEIDHL